MRRKKQRTGSSGRSPRRSRDGFWFDEKEADRRCEFIEGLLEHQQGEHAGKPFTLIPWERPIVRDVFGWKRPDGLRRYREVYIEVAKGNGKSPFAAALLTCCLFMDQEQGAELFTIANDKDQARIPFNDARGMIAESPPLARRAIIFTNSIVVPGTRSVLRPLSTKLGGKHGQRPHALLFDELHEFEHRELVEFLTAGTRKRRQPLTIYATTAGIYDPESIGWEIHDYADKVLRGVIRDDEFYPVIYAAPLEADWTKHATWKMANPSLGITVRLEDLEKDCQKALEIPARQNAFRRLKLNQWTQAAERAIDIEAWNACDKPVQFKAGGACYGGIDLSSKLDLTASALVFPHEDGTYSVLPKFWLPKANLIKRVRKDRVRYDLWERQGLLVTTPGNSVDQAFVRKQWQEWGELFDVREIGIDPWNAAQMQVWLEEDGFELVEMRQGPRTMSEPTKLLLGLIKDKKIRHGGNPILRWNADNLELRYDVNDNVAPKKGRGTQRNRIDGMIALIEGLGRAMFHEESVYESRGVRTA